MTLRPLLYAIAVFVLTGVISMAVAGIIVLLYRIVRRNEGKKQLTKIEPNPKSPESPTPEKKGA